MSFGVGYGDILTALRHGHQLYSSFADDFESAPQQIRDLLRTSRQLRDTVGKYVVLFQHWGQQLPGVDSIVGKLDEADHFVKKYSVLVPEHGSSSADRVKRIWATSRHAFDGNKAEKITEGLQLQLTMLLASVFLFGLQNAQNQAVHRHDHFYDHDNSADGARGRTEFDQLERLSRKILLLRNERQRIAGEFRRRRLEPNYTSDDTQLRELWHNNDLRLQELWAQLCVDDGIVDGSSAIPPLPIQDTTAGQLPSNFLQGIVLNRDLSTIHAPVRRGNSIPQPLIETIPSTPTSQYPPISPYGRFRSLDDAFLSDASPPVSKVNTISTSLASSPSTFITTGTSSLPPAAPNIKSKSKEPSPLLLGDPGIPTHWATFAPFNSKKRIKLDYYHFATVPGTSPESGASGGRVLEWRGENHAHLVRHHIPAYPIDTYPYTKHSRLEKNKLRLTIHTPGHSMHQIIVKDGEKVVLKSKDEVEYRFTSEEKFKDFHSDLRDREFLGSFEADRIKCKHNAHVNECVKLWRNRDGEADGSLTYFASGSDEGDVEYPLRWFVSPVKRNDAKREVTLDLIKKPSDSDTKKKISNMVRRKSSSATSPQNIFGSDFSLTPPLSTKRNSAVTMESTSSSNATSDDAPPYCPDVIYDKIRTITLTFTSKDHFRSFLKTYQLALQPSSDRQRSISSAFTTWAEREALCRSRTSSVYSLQHDTISELGDPAMAGAHAAATSSGQGMYFQPHGDAQELPVEKETSSSKLFGATTMLSPPAAPGNIQHPRLSPPSPGGISPSSVSPFASTALSSPNRSMGSVGGFGHSYDVPELSPFSVRLPAELDPQLHTQRVLEMEGSRQAGPGPEKYELGDTQLGVRYDLDDGEGRNEPRFEIGDAQYGEVHEMPTRAQTRKGKEQAGTESRANGSVNGSGQKYIPYRPR